MLTILDDSNIYWSDACYYFHFNSLQSLFSRWSVSRTCFSLTELYSNFHALGLRDGNELNGMKRELGMHTHSLTLHLAATPSPSPSRSSPTHVVWKILWSWLPGIFETTGSALAYFGHALAQHFQYGQQRYSYQTEWFIKNLMAGIVLLQR